MLKNYRCVGWIKDIHLHYIFSLVEPSGKDELAMTLFARKPRKGCLNIFLQGILRHEICKRLLYLLYNILRHWKKKGKDVL